jgi:MFS transporter, DHA2 family, multidrug resistance protein
VGLVSLVIWEWFQKAPVVDVRMFRNLNFSIASFMMFMLGFAYFSSLVMVPLFLQTLLGYTAQLAGFAISPGGAALLIMTPIVGFLTTKFRARYLVAFGWLYLAGAMLYSTIRIDLQISFNSALWLRVAQVAGLGFLFVPINLSSYIGVPADKNNAVAGLMNFMRNIGSSVGTSFVTTMIARRSQFHQEILIDYTRPGNPNFENSTNALAQQLAHSGLGTHEAQMQAIARTYQAVQAQAGTLAYVDIFKVLGVASAIMFFLAFTLKKNELGGGHVVLE